MTALEITTERERLDQLESDQHLFEMYLSDHIDNHVQRMMEGVGLNPKPVLEIKEF